MKLVEFIENRYQELTFQLKEAYDVRKDSEIKTLQLVLNTYRTALKWWLVPSVVMHYVSVLLGRKPAPKPVLIEQAKAAREAEAKARAEAEQAQYQKSAELTLVPPQTS